MFNIPIVVSKLSQGKKQTTLHNSITDQKLPSSPPPYYESTNKVRIRRIQSSSSSRKFPKDFFATDVRRQTRNTINKQSKDNDVKPYGQRTGSFLTIGDVTRHVQFNINNEVNETPKFKHKINKNDPFSYKNQTLRSGLNNYKQNHKLEPLKKQEWNKNQQIIFFDNTFACVSVKPLNELNIKGISKPEKQNLPMRKIKASKDTILKKYKFFKEEKNNSRQKDQNLFKF